MLKALGIGFLLLEAALSQTTNLLSSSEAAETQTAEPPHASRPDAPGTIDGVVTDGSGSVVVGALVTLGSTASTGKRTTVTNETGSFHFAAVAPGNYTITIVADGFAPWTAASVVVRAGENPAVTSAVLQVASASIELDVGLSPKELAVEQLKAEEKQRLLGVFPHYFVTYDPNAAPLNAAQKFQLGWKTVLDPITILSSAIAAGIQQARNSYHEFGQGMERAMESVSGRSTPMASTASSLAASSCRRSFIRIPATFTRAPAAFARGHCMPSRPHSFARVITDTGSPIIPMSWGVWRPARSRPCIIQPVREPDCGFFMTFCGISAAERQAICSKSSCCAR